MIVAALIIAFGAMPPAHAGNTYVVEGIKGNEAVIKYSQSLDKVSEPLKQHELGIAFPFTANRDEEIEGLLVKVPGTEFYLFKEKLEITVECATQISTAALSTTTNMATAGSGGCEVSQ